MNDRKNRNGLIRRSTGTPLMTLAALALAAPALAAPQPGALGETFGQYLSELPEKAFTDAGRELLQRYRDNRERLADVDLVERAALPEAAKRCNVDEAPYRRLLGLDINPETMLIRQIVNGSASNIGVGFEDFTVYAIDTCPNDVETGDVTFWVEYDQVMKRRPPEVGTDIEAAKQQYESWQGDRMKQHKRLDGRFEAGRPSGVFTVITHIFPLEKAAEQMEAQGQDPSMMESHMYGYLKTDGFDRSSTLMVQETDDMAMSNLLVTLYQARADKPGALNTMLTITESSYMDQPLIGKQWMEQDAQGRLHGWVYRKGHKDSELRKACFARNEPASPDQCEPL